AMNWLIRIMSGKKFACGGAYYSREFVLTSASCMHAYKDILNDLIVEFFNSDADENEFSIISNMYVPKKYVFPGNNMDIAVIKLLTPMPDENYDYVTLCKKPLLDYAKVTVVACGTSKSKVTLHQSQLLNQNQCQSHFNDEVRPKTIGCTKQRRKDQRSKFRTCARNFGCPILTSENELCGIVVAGPECNNPRLPSFFTDIYQVKSFIEK
ncbi:CG34130, partial [Drosophila busckii]